MKCSVDAETDLVACVVAGDRPAWGRCFFDTDCQTGTFCDGPTEVCHPICHGASQCGRGGQCIPARGDDGRVIGADLSICTSNCEPISADPCDQSFGNTSCIYDPGGGYWDCTMTTGLAEGSACAGPKECNMGLVCLAEGTCRAWCTPLDQSCDGAASLCTSTNPATTWNDQEMGVCQPL